MEMVWERRIMNFNNMDMLKFFEQAMSLSNMFKASNEETESSTAPNFLQIMQMLNSFNQTNNESHNAALHQSTELSWQLLCVNAALPFLEFRFQKILGAYIRIVELQNILELTEEAYKEYGNTDYDTNEKKADWRLSLLNAVRPHAPFNAQQKIDFMVKFLELSNFQ